MSTLFSRASRRKNEADERGAVCVTIILLDPVKRRHKRGNITRSMTIENTKVSEVAVVLEQVLGKSVA